MFIDQEAMKLKVKRLRWKKLKTIVEDEPEIYLLDVRPDNYKKITTFIDKTIRCSIADLEDNYKKIPTDKKLIITDAYMKQSPIAARYLMNKGYDVHGVLMGGVALWKDKGEPVVSEIEVEFLKDITE